MKLTNVLPSILILAALLGLISVIYSGFHETYSFHPTDYIDGKNIIQSLNDINFIGGINQTVTSFYKIVNPTNVFDVVGGLLTGGIGAVRTALGFVSLVPEILLVITNYYTGFIPPIVSQILGILFSLYAGLILLYYITGRGE